MFALRRVDLPGAPTQIVQLSTATGLSRRTRLGTGPEKVETAEHLLSALAGCGVVAALVELDAPELPALDGSATPWVELITPHLVSAKDPRAPWQVARRFEYRLGDSVCCLEPSAEGLVDCTIDFPHPLIGKQQRQWAVGDHGSYVTEIAPARTFGFLEDAQQLWAAGLAQGADSTSVVVFDQRGLLSGELRFSDEPVRHKLLDVIGDLALLGAPLMGRVSLERPSHRLVVEALQQACGSGALVQR
ncbi:MAG: UDP-3-O-acyl-N-acetylglucosamine deacetylase [Deltaproteobacteria bacterium]|nr:UDP-3-O-acyl-N-acetylglucosamine deacetylase [Deltaproteobacteria bacterium]